MSFVVDVNNQSLVCTPLNDDNSRFTCSFSNDLQVSGLSFDCEDSLTRCLIACSNVGDEYNGQERCVSRCREGHSFCL